MCRFRNDSSLRLGMALAGAMAMMACMTAASAQGVSKDDGSHASQQLVVIDTDIGDDIDDVFALGLALSSPELRILGITSEWGDTALKSRLLDRLLCETGRSDIPVATGIRTTGKMNTGVLSQGRWAERQPDRPHPEAVEFLLEQIRQHPGEITLIGLGPLTNVGAAIERDAATFRKLKRVVIMGGSVRRGYDNYSYMPARGPDVEYNIAMDVAAAQKLFTAGVPLYVMPLDSTQLKLDESKRQLLFAQGTNLTDAMALLYHQWSAGHGLVEPTLFDDIAVSYAIDSSYCPASPLRLVVDEKGYTREIAGPANTFVCLENDSDKFFGRFMTRLMQQRLAGSCVANGAAKKTP